MTPTMLLVAFRHRWFLLALIFSACLLSYLSFDAYTRPRTTTVQLDYDPYSKQDGNVSPSRILIVSAMFPLPKSKHSKTDYNAWLSHFLRPIKTDVYFFTTPELEPIVRSARGNLPITVNTSFSSPFDIPPLAGMQEKYVEMRIRDRERWRHSPDLYAIWNGKPYYLDEAVKNSPSKYDYAFWNDAGSFRVPHHYENWPDAGRIDEVWAEGSKLSGTNQADLLFFPINNPPHASMRYWREEMGPVDNEFIEGKRLLSPFYHRAHYIYSLIGSFFGGTPQTISWWRSVFYDYHNGYLDHQFFVGKDQTLINAIALLFPTRFITVWLKDPAAPAGQGLQPLGGESPLGSCGPQWFYYQWWLAGDTERSTMRRKWQKAWRLSWDWWKTGNSCRMTQV